MNNLKTDSHITTKYYKAITQGKLPNQAYSNYLLTNLYVQNPANYSEDQLIGTVSLKIEVTNGVVVNVYPRLTFTTLFQGMGQDTYVSFNGLYKSSVITYGDYTTKEGGIWAPEDIGIKGIIVEPGISYYITRVGLVTEPSIDVSYYTQNMVKSATYLQFDDLTVTCSDCSRMLRVNARIDHVGDLVTVMYTADSIINLDINKQLKKIVPEI